MKISIFSNQAADMSLADLPSRICKFLLLTTPVAHNTTGEISIRSPLNQSELATLLGVHRVTLYKALKTLESHGIIAGFSRDTVNIADCTRFVACAQMDKI